MPIEKVWRECQNRVLARAQEIKGRADMLRVVTEVWDGLGFEPSDKWCGINKLVDQFIPCLQEIVDIGGWDTHYM